MALKGMTSTAFFAVLISVLSQIYIPVGSVPHTLQVLAVALAGIVLGSKYGALSVILWILLGFFGVPVFTMGQAGPAVLIGPLGGFCFGFIVQAWICGYISRMEGWVRPVAVAVVALLAVYGIGIAGFLACFAWMLHKPMTITQAVMICAVPFVPFDLIKSVAAIALGKKIIFALDKAGLHISAKNNV